MSSFILSKGLRDPKHSNTFRCPSCSKMLVLEHQGTKYKLVFVCMRCKCTITLECKSAPPILIHSDMFIASVLNNIMKQASKDANPKLVAHIKEALTYANSIIPKEVNT